MHQKGISLNTVEKFLSHSADKIRRRPFLCFERIQVSKSFKQRRGKLHGFCRNFFYLTGPKKLRQGTILCYRKFLVGKNILWIKGGVITVFRRSFCLTVPKYFIGEHFGVSEKFFYRKFSCIGGEGASRFCWIFLSHSAENFCKGILLFLRKFWVQKVLWLKRGYHIFPLKNFGITVPKNFV